MSPIVEAVGLRKSYRRGPEEVRALRNSGRLPAEVSLGERQRVAMARAMVVRPRLLLADEPTGHQDADWATAVFDAVRDLAHQGSCCLVATHSQESLSLADRVLTITDGVLPAQTGVNHADVSRHVHAVTSEQGTGMGLPEAQVIALRCVTDAPVAEIARTLGLDPAGSRLTWSRCASAVSASSSAVSGRCGPPTPGTAP